MAFWSQSWEKRRKQLVRDLKIFDRRLVRNLLEHISEVEGKVKELIELLLYLKRSLGPHLGGLITKQRAEKRGKEAALYIEKLKPFQESLLKFKKAVSELKKYEKSLRGHDLLKVIAVVQAADRENILEVLSVDEKKEIYVIAKLEEKFKALQENLQGFTPQLIKTCEYLIKDEGLDTSYENRGKAGRISRELYTELEKLVKFLSATRGAVINLFESAKKDMEKELEPVGV